ncbi:uncharacterized protein LAJ45_03837 [Morchella importuna]|uniref:Mid2 domain-containing protein n=1 Tax=Morchella conica CCBAS932 TaxID=1392247 RepID=A0A3N4L1M0_9PEZI|nr:uncharacterized protein LAJ45_03837 [Morchella importuna]KAH8151844.1 hypothetical protein LAJ45_03837 [Morchella importuna]RPB16716.1 hypothetical protein P167DRAFT_570477 [Morchella conica CCBAS932]
MSIISFIIRILPILLLTTPTASLITDPVALTVNMPRSTSAPLTDCASVCALMETQIHQVPGPDQGSLFRSLCINSGRNDCDTLQAEFRVELVGKADGFKCLCARNGVPGEEYSSTTTTTSTSTITMTEWDVPAADTTSAPTAKEAASTDTAEQGKATGVASVATSSVSMNTEPTQPSVTTPIQTSVSDPITTALIETLLPSIRSTILSTHTTLSTVRYAVSPTSKSPTTSSTPKATPPNLEAELNTINQPQPSKKPKSGAIVGIVLGVLAVCAIIGGGVWYIRKRQMAKVAEKKFDYDY